MTCGQWAVGDWPHVILSHRLCAQLACGHCPSEAHAAPGQGPPASSRDGSRSDARALGLVLLAAHLSPLAAAVSI